MNARIHLIWVSLAAAGILLAGGCQEPSKPTVQAKEPPRASSVSNEKQMQGRARDYWVSYNVPPINRAAKKKIAVAELDVEFVTEQLEPSSDGQGLPFVAKTTDFGEGLKMELPGMLYSMLTEDANLDLVPMDKVNEAKAYALLKGTRMGEPLPAYRLFIVGSDVGRPKEACLYTTYGLKAIDPRQKDVESVLGDLLKETGADVVMRLRLRVGVYQGRAAIQRGSVIDLTGKSQIGSLESIRSLVGDELVVDDPADKIAGLTVYRVDSDKFRQSIRKLVVPYMRMAVMATQK